jgi:hypothetical protein
MLIRDEKIFSVLTTIKRLELTKDAFILEFVCMGFYRWLIYWEKLKPPSLRGTSTA